MALPGKSGRGLGLRFRRADDFGGFNDRRESARKVLLHAPKNGIFYVLDRATGALISAKPYTHITWASGVDMKTGRPVEIGIGALSGTQVRN